MSSSPKQYIEFGTHLRVMRIQAGQTAEQLANALKVDRTLVSKYENGHERPSVAILHKLNSHFSLSHDEAINLWVHAGRPTGMMFSQKESEGILDKTNSQLFAPQQAQQPTNMNINIDPVRTPVMYTDSAFVQSNDAGLTIDFAQSVGPINQLVVQTRVGMSKEQAKRLIDALKDNLGIE